MVVVSTRREESCRVAEALGQLEAEDVAVETERAVKVGHLQVDVADVGARVDRPPGRELLRLSALLALPPSLARPAGAVSRTLRHLTGLPPPRTTSQRPPNSSTFWHKI